MRGLVLMGFSAACLGVSALAYQTEKSRELTMGLRTTVGAAFTKCQEDGIDTPFGRIGCFQTTSAGFSGGNPKGIRDNRGGAMFVRH